MAFAVMAAVHGALMCAGFWFTYRSVNPCTAATNCLTADGDGLHLRCSIMLKIVPDPPHTYHSLEDTLIQAAEYALCAQTVAQQAVLLQPKSPGSVLIMATMHELEALRALLEAALIQVQLPCEPRTLH